MKVSIFEVTASDGRKIRHSVTDREGENSLDFLRSKLVSNDYVVTGQVYSPDEDGKGGWVMPINPGSSGSFATFLEAHGNELAEWLQERGFRSVKK